MMGAFGGQLLTLIFHTTLLMMIMVSPTPRRRRNFFHTLSMMMASALAELSHWCKDTSPLLMMMLAGVAGMCPFSCHSFQHAMMARRVLGS